MSVKIGVAPSAWDWTGGGPSFFRFVEACEELGWDSIWLSDRVISERMNLEPVTTLAAVAARTRTLKFGTSVIALSIRNPVVLAKELANVDFLSGGRLLPAVGLGAEDEREYEAAGVRKQDRGARTDEAIGLLRRLWQEDAVTHNGRFYHLTNVTIRPKPLFKPHLPLWIGGRTAYAWSRVARLGDGWLASSVTPEEVAQGTQAIKAELRSNGRQIEDDHYGVLLSTYLAVSHQEALNKLPAGTGRLRPDIPIDSYAALGTPEDIHRRIQQYLACGASKFVFRLACREEEALEQLRLLAETVVVPVNTMTISYASSVTADNP